MLKTIDQIHAEAKMEEIKEQEMIGDMEPSSGSYNPWRLQRKEKYDRERRGMIVDNIYRRVNMHARNKGLT